MAQNQPNLPPNIKARCPMCGSTNLQWGHVRARGLSFVKPGDNIALKFVVKRAVRMVAAECQNCKYLLIFNRGS